MPTQKNKLYFSRMFCYVGYILYLEYKFLIFVIDMNSILLHQFQNISPPTDLYLFSATLTGKKYSKVVTSVLK